VVAVTLEKQRFRMTSQAIPERSTSRYSGQYARAVDPQRLLEIFTESNKIAITSKNPVTARSRFELAVEAYHQLMSMGLPSDLNSSVQNAMSTLAGSFATQVCINEAIGLCAKASKLKSARRKLEYLNRARDVLHASLATSLTGATAIQDTHNHVLADIAQIEAVTREAHTAAEK